MDKYEIEKLIEQALNGISITNFQFDQSKTEASFSFRADNYIAKFSQTENLIKIKDVSRLAQGTGYVYPIPSDIAILMKICIEKQIQINSLKK